MEQTLFWSMMKNNIEITVLVDNKSLPELSNEHGFSMLIKTNDQKILFDTGQNNVLRDNSEKLGVDLAEIDTLVLSHGHYDHTGGVSDVLRKNKTVHIYLNSAAFLPRYSIRNDIPKSIQMPLKSRDRILQTPVERLHWISDPTQITDDIGLTGSIPRETTFEDTGGPFFLDPKSKIPDPIEDDQAMWIKTSEGLVVCVGCSHSGIINTLNYITKVTKESRIHTLIGGFHLVNADQNRIDQTIEKLKEFNIKHLIPCHCSGDDAMKEISTKIEGVTLGHAGLIHKITLG